MASLEKEILNLTDADSDLVAVIARLVQKRGKIHKVPQFRAAARMIKKAAVVMAKAEREFR